MSVAWEAAPICAPATAVAMPAVYAAPVGVSARPVYQKSWLFGRWEYKGHTDVKYHPYGDANSYYPGRRGLSGRSF